MQTEEKTSEKKHNPAMEVRDVHFSYGKNKILKGAGKGQDFSKR